LVDDSKEIGKLLEDTLETSKKYKDQRDAYRKELTECRDNAKCDGADSVTLRETVKDEEDYIA
jgi:hypothetical protein